MRDADNDNEPLSFIHIAAATANVTRYLQLNKKSNEQGEGKPDPNRTDEQKRKADSEYVAKRIRDIEVFERRAKGLGKNRA